MSVRRRIQARASLVEFAVIPFVEARGCCKMGVLGFACMHVIYRRGSTTSLPPVSDSNVHIHCLDPSLTCRDLHP